VSSKSISPKIALDATLRAAAGFGFPQQWVGRTGHRPTHNRQLIPSSALRFKLFKRKQGRLFIFAIDLSGSMALNRIGQAKGMIHALLRESYIKRDSVAIVGFRGTSAELLLPPSRSILRARRVLDSVGVGGATPLSAGLDSALRLAQRVGSTVGEKFLLVFTDGQANVSLKTMANSDRVARQRLIDAEIAALGLALKTAGVSAVVISTQSAYLSTGVAERLAEQLGARFELVATVHSR
jgi:magnesium chelatase subunit D